MAEDAYYRPAGFLTRRVMQPVVNALMRLGVSVWGSRILEVRGRRSGEPRRVPVNLCTVDGHDHLVAPRGQTQWVRNLRAAGEGRLLLGRTAEPFTAVELADGDKGEVLRAYLRRWAFEAGAFFDGVDADSPEGEIERIAPDHPVFRIDRRSAAASGE